jgi:ferredoxin-thioredoxin reductase catalytic subunit
MSTSHRTKEEIKSYRNCFCAFFVRERERKKLLEEEKNLVTNERGHECEEM